MTSVRSLAFSLLGSAAFLLAAGALAQEPEETVPRELALALLCSFSPTGDESLDLRVGMAPDDLPSGLVPANARILGSLVRSHGSTVVAVVPEAPDEALASYRANRASEGWEPPPMEQRGGFLPTSVALPTGFCREGAFLSVGARPWDESGTLLRITTSRDPRRTPCDPEMRRLARHPEERMPIPALIAPVGAVQGGVSGSGGSDHTESSTWVESRLTAAELSAHYVAQLQREGWKIEDGLAGETLAVHRLRAHDDEGREWVGVLVATAVSETPRYDLIFRAVDPSSTDF
jgi:hypothetical protein